MSSSFGVVEDKLREASFFLEKLSEASNLSFKAGCYFSAFLSASRSVTFAMQSSMNGVEGFSVWYERMREKLKTDSVAPLFVEIRNDVVHKGLAPLNITPIEHIRESVARQMRGEMYSHFLCLPRQIRGESSSIVDAHKLCTEYFRSLIELVFDCYQTFKFVVSPRWYFTEENFLKREKGMADALAEQGLPMDWAKHFPPGGDPWSLMRRHEPYCPVNDLFHQYLGKIVEEPD